MDLERIKQNFRIRSGRARQQKRKPKANPVTVTGEQPQLPTNSQNGEVKRPASKQRSSHEEPLKAEASVSVDQQGEQSQSVPAPEKSRGIENSQGNNATQESASDIQEATIADIEDQKKPKDESPVRDLSDFQTSRAMSQPHHPNNDTNASSSEAEDFDLSPPKPRSRPPSLEDLAELLFSSEHLDALLHHPPQLARFSWFLQKYLPDHQPFLAQYLETQKAIRAVAYANALADGLSPQDIGSASKPEKMRRAASLDPDFEAASNACFHALVGNALPSFVSYSLVKAVSDSLINEVTGRSTPYTRDLVAGLSEVFCLTDPTQQDNPVIYASDEFYRLTRYGPEDALNNNCRFLQGRRTNPESRRRLKSAIQNGEEISEAILNYRRDGRPFLNLLMIAPLHDSQGRLKYHIGAQVDVTGLVERGRVLQGFQHFLNRRAARKKQDGPGNTTKDLDDDQRRKRRALAKLRDLSEMFDLEESAVVQTHSRSNSLERDNDDNGSVGSIERTPRRIYADSDASESGNEEDENAPKSSLDLDLGHSGDGKLSGKLPGVYESFLLFRPAPSFRIVFISPKLRRFGSVLQTPFLSHVAAPGTTLTGLSESLRTGVPVSAKVHFTPERTANRGGTRLKNGTKHEDGENGKAIWVSCTPLLSEDERIGVWMCVVVEKSRIGPVRRTVDNHAYGEIDRPSKFPNNKSSDKRHRLSPNIDASSQQQQSRDQEDLPIKPVRINSQTDLKATNHEDHGEEERNRNLLRQQDSVYFDSNQDLDLDQKVKQPESNETNSANEETEINKFEPNTQNDTLNRKTMAVLIPVEEYKKPARNPKQYSVDIYGLSSKEDYDLHGDDYITTRSSHIHPQQENGSVLIEEDSEDRAEDELDHQRENLEVGSLERGHLRDARTPSPVHSPPSAMRSSISSARHPSEKDKTVDSSSHQASRQSSSDPHPSQDSESLPAEENGQKQDIYIKDLKDNIQDQEDSAQYEEDSIQHQGESEQVPADNIHNQENNIQHQGESEQVPEDSIQHQDGSVQYQEDGEQSSDTLRDVSQDRTSDTQFNYHLDRDSAISIDSPQNPRSTKEETATRSSSSLHESPSPQFGAETDAIGSHDHKDGEDGESTRPDLDHELDVEDWVTDGRPASHRRPPNLNMDYFRAGSTRWSGARPLRLSRDPAGGHSHKDGYEEEEDDELTNDFCVRSPYSVD